MRTVGIDIGSRTIKLAVWDGAKIVEIRQDDTGFDPLTRARRLLEGVACDRIMATGYGRNLLELALDSPKSKRMPSAPATIFPRRAPCWTSAARTARPSP